MDDQRARRRLSYDGRARFQGVGLAGREGRSRATGDEVYFTAPQLGAAVSEPVGSAI